MTRPVYMPFEDALMTKISRERVGEELDKMFKGKFYDDALHAILETLSLQVEILCTHFNC